MWRAETRSFSSGITAAEPVDTSSIAAKLAKLIAKELRAAGLLQGAG